MAGAWTRLGQVVCERIGNASPHPIVCPGLRQKTTSNIDCSWSSLLTHPLSRQNPSHRPSRLLILYQRDQMLYYQEARRAVFLEDVLLD